MRISGSLLYCGKAHTFNSLIFDRIVPISTSTSFALVQLLYMALGIKWNFLVPEMYRIYPTFPVHDGSQEFTSFGDISCIQDRANFRYNFLYSPNFHVLGTFHG